MSLTLLLLIVLVICAIGWGGYGYPRWRGPQAPTALGAPPGPAPGPYWVGGFAPLGFILVVVLVLVLFGGLRLR